MVVSAQSQKPAGPGTHSFRDSVEQLRCKLKKTSIPAAAVGGPGARVFEQLVLQAGSAASHEGLSWELRVVKGFAGNAFSLPDGAVYVDDELARSLGNEPGLWAAVLTHEIVHITEHHWTKRAEYADSLRDSHSNRGVIQLGAFLTAIPSTEPQAERERKFLDFTQDLEAEADAGSLWLMARSGFHPDFVIALFHLMEAQQGKSGAGDLPSSHPGWAAREAHLRPKYSPAVAEFERLWPDAASSPGGKPPVLAFLGRVEAKLDLPHMSAQLTLPIRCENAIEPVDVLLLVRNLMVFDSPGTQKVQKIRQTIDCESDWTVVRFVLDIARAHDEGDTELFVMDNRGWVVGRAPKLNIQY